MMFLCFLNIHRHPIGSTWMHAYRAFDVKNGSLKETENLIVNPKDLKFHCFA
jgi:hypothetical protein